MSNIKRKGAMSSSGGEINPTICMRFVFRVWAKKLLNSARFPLDHCKSCQSLEDRILFTSGILSKSSQDILF